MANRFWTGLVGTGTGTWDATNILNWSTTSGGIGGASVPATGDSAIFDNNSGAGVCTIGANVTALALVCVGYTGTLAFGTNKVSLSAGAGFVYRGDSTYSVTGTPLVELTFAGATTGAVISNTISEANAISFNVLAGTGTITFGSGGVGGYKNINLTGFAGTFAFSATASALTIYGDLTIPATVTPDSGTGAYIFGATSGTHVITTNGTTIDRPMTINGVGGSWMLGDNLTLGATRGFTLTNGTFDANGHNISIGSFALGSGTKTLTLGSGTWSCGGGWNAAANGTGLTVPAAVGTISMISTSAKTFAGNGKTWPVLNQGDAGTLTITGANTFADISNSVNGTTVTLPANTTTTVSILSLHGAAGSLTTLNSSTPGAKATLSKPSGSVYASYLAIQDIAATGGATFEAVNSSDLGNNSGWIFSFPPFLAKSEQALRSFTVFGRV